MHIRSFAIGSMMLIAAGGAHASASASASISNLQYQLIDLDPSDGVTPYIAFLTQSSSGANAGSQMGTAPGFSNSDFKTGNAFQPPSTSAEVPYASASNIATLNADASLNISSNAVADKYAHTDAEGSAGLDLVRYTSSGMPNFLLTPHTELIISGFGSVNATATPFAWSHAGAGMYLAGVNPGDYLHASHAGLFEAAGLFVNPGSPTTGFLRVEFENDSDNIVGGVASVGTDVVAAAPVPEPGELSTSSLALISVLSSLYIRRRRRAAA